MEVKSVRKLMAEIKREYDKDPLDWKIYTRSDPTTFCYDIYIAKDEICTRSKALKRIPLKR